jgi:ATP-dependent Clp protease adaptor protein ClpS
MAKPKLKPEIKTESLVSAAPRWNVVVLNDPINYQAYVVLAFMNVLRVGAPEAKRLMRAIHADGRATVWTGDRERAEMLSLELQQWHLNSLLEQDG